AAALIGWTIRRFARIAISLIVVVCAGIGIATLSNIVNPGTIIANAADVAALTWIRDAVPRSATFIGRVQPWYGGAFIGTDGAYWASVLADRRTLPPPTLYGWTGGYGEMELFLARWRDEYPFVTRSTLAEAR